MNASLSSPTRAGRRRRRPRPHPDGHLRRGQAARRHPAALEHGGVQDYAKSLAEALGPPGITVNTLLPGYTRTDRLGALAARDDRPAEETEAAWAEQNALKRLGEPEEFAAAVAFLASRPAAYITGGALPVDGGRSKHLL